MHFGNVTIHLIPLLIFGAAIAIIYLLSKWSQELAERRFTVVLYFLISANITPLYSVSGPGGIFQLWFPLGFGFCLLYLIVNGGRRHPAKLKAFFLGLTVATYQLLTQYGVITI
jgi:hypothetical protein